MRIISTRIATGRGARSAVALAFAATCAGRIRGAAEVRRHARDRHRLCRRCRRCRGIRPTGTGSTTTTPASSTSSCSPPTSPSRRRNGGKHPFYADAWLPSDAIRGELAESWEWKQNPLRVEIKLRKGMMFPEKPGVMAARELVADDVVFSLQPPRQEPEEDRRLFRSRRQGRGHRQAHGGLHLQGLQRRMGLSLRLGLLLRHHAEGGRRRRRRQLEERQRHRAVHARPISCRATPTPTSRTRTTGTRRRSTAATYKLPLRRQGRLSHHQGRGDLPHRAAHRPSSTFSRTSAGQAVDELKKSAPQLQVVEMAAA